MFVIYKGSIYQVRNLGDNDIKILRRDFPEALIRIYNGQGMKIVKVGDLQII